MYKKNIERLRGTIVEFDKLQQQNQSIKLIEEFVDQTGCENDKVDLLELNEDDSTIILAVRLPLVPFEWEESIEEEEYDEFILSDDEETTFIDDRYVDYCSTDEEALQAGELKFTDTDKIKRVLDEEELEEYSRRISTGYGNNDYYEETWEHEGSDRLAVFKINLEPDELKLLSVFKTESGFRVIKDEKWKQFLEKKIKSNEDSLRSIKENYDSLKPKTLERLEEFSIIAPTVPVTFNPLYTQGCEDSPLIPYDSQLNDAVKRFHTFQAKKEFYRNY